MSGAYGRFYHTAPIEALSTTDTIKFVRRGIKLLSPPPARAVHDTSCHRPAVGRLDGQTLIYCPQINGCHFTGRVTVPAWPNGFGASLLNGSYLSPGGYFLGDVNFTPDDTFSLTNANSSAPSTLGPIVNGLELFSLSGGFRPTSA